MSPTPSPVSPSPQLTDEATLEVAIEYLSEHLPVEMPASCPAQTLYQVLLWAASRHDSIEHTCQVLTQVPSGNGIRHHLAKFSDMATLERQVNQALQHRLPDQLENRRQRLAIDLHLIPYYGQPTETEAGYLYRSQAKAGTTTFFAYGSVYAIRAHQRVTLAIHAIRRGETLVATLTYLLAQLTPLRIKIERRYLDRGFYCVPVIRWLKALSIPFLMPVIVRGKQGGTRAFCHGRTSYQSEYTLRSQRYGTVSHPIAIVCRYRCGRRGAHGVDYLLYVAYRLKVALHQLPGHYKQRFGIETSYRLKNTCRIRTATKRPIWRFLFVALAFILVNLWIWLLWRHLSRRRRGFRRIYQECFPLRTFLEFLSHAVERQFPLMREIYLPDSP